MSRLERNLQTELYVPRSALAEHGIVAGRVGCAQGVTEASGSAAGRTGARRSEIPMIENVKELRPEFGSGSLSQMPALGD